MVFLATQGCRLRLNRSQVLFHQVHLASIFLLLVRTSILNYWSVCPPGSDGPLLDDLLIVTILGHDDEPTEYVGMQQQQQQHKTNQPPECVSTVDEICPEDAIKKEKCIVFTGTLMALITSLYGSICKQRGWGCALKYHITYVGRCLVPWWCSSGHAGHRWAAQPCCNKIRASCSCFCFVVVWEFLHEGRVDVQLL